jgi:hypothetical protein
MAINLVQNLNVEVDSTELLKQYLELALPTVLNSIEEIAIKVIDHNDEHKKIYYPSAIYSEKSILPILLIGGWYKSKDNKENSFFDGYEPWKLFKNETALKDSIDYIMTILDENQRELSKRFFKDCGDGYNDNFNHYDGSVNVGFKLISNCTFPNSLSLSMTHIYYGK